MGDIIPVIEKAFMSIKERPGNFIHSALWSFALSVAFMAVFMAFYLMFALTSFSAASSGAAAGISGMAGAIALMFAVIFAIAILAGPFSIVASMLYAKGSLEGKDIGLGDYIAAVKEKYVRLFLASIVSGIFSLVAMALLLIVLGGIGYGIYLFAGKALLPDMASSYLLLAVAAFIAIISFVVVSVGVSLLTSLYIPYVFSKQKLAGGLVGSFMRCIALAKARKWEILAYLLVMFVISAAFMVAVMALSLVPCIGYIATLLAMVVGFAINFASAYVLLYFVKDAA
jgi:hypothetical protein